MEIIARKIFVFDKIMVFFKHTDYHGFVHPYNYLEWTSFVREAFFSEVCKSFREILYSPVKMMTAKIHSTMHADAVFGDSIMAKFTVFRIKKVSFDVVVRFFRKSDNKFLCETRHTLVFVDSNSEKFTAIPQDLNHAILDYEEVDDSIEHQF